MSRITPGTYKGRGVAGSAQTGRSSNGTEQVAIDLEIPALGRTLTTFLYFSEDAAPYALDRLAALGWEESDDPTFPGIDKNEVDVRVWYDEYRGEEKLKVEIVTAGGRVIVKDRMNEREEKGFMQRLRQMNRSAGPQSVKKADAPPAAQGGAAAGAGGKLAL